MRIQKLMRIFVRVGNVLHLSCLQCPSPLTLPLSIFFLSYRDRHPSVIYFHHCSRKTVAEPVVCTLPVFVDMANFTSSAPPGSGIVFFSKKVLLSRRNSSAPGPNGIPNTAVWL